MSIEDIQRYHILKQIGKGGNGQVYLAMDEKLGIHRVIKKISMENTSDGERLRQQLIHEVQLLKELNHPFIPKVMDIIRDHDMVGIVMEYIDGQNLRQYIMEEGTVDEEVLVDWAWQLADILRYLHGRQPPMLHKDVKPSNVILHPSGCLYLIDFGIAGVGSCTDMMQGTSGYAAPEVYMDHVICDDRTDIYGLGRTLFFCNCKNPSGEEHKLSMKLYHILKKCTDISPEKRYCTALELMEDLKRLRYQGMRRNRGMFRRKLCGNRKNLGYLALGLSVSIFIGCCIHRESRLFYADQFVERAREALEPEQMMDSYKKALEKAPWLEKIYISMADDFILQNHFTTDEAVKLLNLLDETNALTSLKRQNKEAYARFCYNLGIGYFYEMGDSRGKQESALWFERAIAAGQGLSDKQRKRAICYEKIGTYYGTFLSFGEEKSGEREEGSFQDFYETLEDLLHYAEEDASLFRKISGEVTVEIRDHAMDFSKKGGISAGKMKDTLKEMEDFCTEISDQMNQREKDELVTMLTEARKSIQIVEDNDENKMQITLSDGSSAGLPAASDKSYGTGY